MVEAQQDVVVGGEQDGGETAVALFIQDIEIPQMKGL